MTMHALMTLKEALVISERLRSWCLKNAIIAWSYLDIILLSIFLLSLIYEIVYGNAPGCVVRYKLHFCRNSEIWRDTEVFQP